MSVTMIHPHDIAHLAAYAQTECSMRKSQVIKSVCEANVRAFRSYYASPTNQQAVKTALGIKGGLAGYIRAAAGYLGAALYPSQVIELVDDITYQIDNPSVYDQNRKTLAMLDEITVPAVAALAQEKEAWAKVGR